MKQTQLDELVQLLFHRDMLMAGPDAHILNAGAAVEKWRRLFERVSRQLVPKEEYGRRIWPALWVRVEREAWAEARSLYVEDEDSDSEEAENEAKAEWGFDCPYETEWLRAVFEQDKDVVGFALMPEKGTVFLDFERGTVTGLMRREGVERSFDEFTDWIVPAYRECLQLLVDDPDGYQAQLDKELPNRERLGKLKRSDTWKPIDDGEEEVRHFLRDELSAAEVDEFVGIAPILVDCEPQENVTLDDYLTWCRACYAAAGFDVGGMTPRACYERYADGRHEDLLDVDPDSASALADWLRNRPRGGYPWEIARGGNSTHISLSMEPDEQGCSLSLAGSAPGRAAETVRMALALHGRGVRFRLYEAEYIRRMVLGEDWIGILPHYFGISPRYCHSFFPEEDDIGSFDSYFTIEEHPELETAIQWYPQEPVRVRPATD